MCAGRIEVGSDGASGAAWGDLGRDRAGSSGPAAGCWAGLRWVRGGDAGISPFAGRCPRFLAAFALGCGSVDAVGREVVDLDLARGSGAPAGDPPVFAADLAGRGLWLPSVGADPPRPLAALEPLELGDDLALCAPPLPSVEPDPPPDPPLPSVGVIGSSRASVARRTEMPQPRADGGPGIDAPGHQSSINTPSTGAVMAGRKRAVLSSATNCLVKNRARFATVCPPVELLTAETIEVANIASWAFGEIDST
jgi:hypothetical protein